MTQKIGISKQDFEQLLVEVQKHLATSFRHLPMNQRDGPATALTESGTAYISYSIGGIKQEGDPHSVFTTNAHKAVDMFMDMLRIEVEKAKKKGFEWIIIRSFPIISHDLIDDTWEGCKKAHYQVYARLAFE